MTPWITKPIPFNIGQGAAASAAAFGPNSISSLWAWFQAESSFMTLSGSDITVWNPQDEDTDKQLISDSTGVAPTLGTYNSRGIAQFDGTEVMHTNDDSYNITQPMTFAIALKFPTAVNYSTIFDVDDTAGGRIVHRNYQTSDRQLQIANSANYESNDEGVISATWGYEILVISGTDTKWRVNGTDVAPVGIDVTDAFKPLTIGSDYRALAGGSLNMVGDFMHFIIYDKAVSGDDLTNLESWLATEVGL